MDKFCGCGASSQWFESTIVLHYFLLVHIEKKNSQKYFNCSLRGGIVVQNT